MLRRLALLFYVGQAISGLVNYPATTRPHSLTIAVATTTATAQPLPDLATCADVSSQIYPSCWDTLGMDDWIVNWNKVTTTCNKGEMWSSCFMRLAFGETGHDCSTLGSLNCTAPELGQTPTEAHAFYGAYNIYAVEQYFSMWEEVIYGVRSRPAISNLVSVLDVPGAPPLTVSSLMVAIVNSYGLNAAVDEMLISILPSGKNATPLDTSQTYMSTQLAQLLSDLLLSLSTNFNDGIFMLMVQHGNLIQPSKETISLLEDNLAGVELNGAQEVAS